jgi:1-aminocyclopropane-1-carboxylate deaminase/D-cysteine desulfhydrase-like pyridoxal-dependent ACC family enzyme
MDPKIDYSVPGFARAVLINGATPLTKAISFENGVRVWIKRDDLIGVALGGNKVRKAEFILADALTKGYNAVITAGAGQSNHARVVAICATMLDLKCYILRPSDDLSTGGNKSLMDTINAKVLSCDLPWERLEQVVIEKADELSTNKEKVYPIALGGSSPVGIMGYALCYSEMMAQARQLELKVSTIVHASSTLGTQAGLLVGKALLRARQKEYFNGYLFDPRIIGVAVSKIASEKKCQELVSRTLKLLNKDSYFSKDDINFYKLSDDPGYEKPSLKAENALKDCLAKLGILLDPVYSSKGFAGLLELIENDMLPPGDVIFIHTGGVPSFFANRQNVK